MITIPWFKVDDNLAFHEKVVSAGNPAMGLWVRAGSWAAQMLTDGLVPHHIVSTLGTKAQAERLVRSRLWESDPSGYRFHEWEGRQPSRTTVELEREAARQRQQRARDAARERAGQGVASRRDMPVSHAEVRPQSRSPRPDPTRPVEETSSLPPLPEQIGSADADDDAEEKKPRRKPERPLPTSWAPNARHHEMANEKRLDIAVAVTAFRNHAETHDRRARDWDAAFRTWLNKTNAPPAVARRDDWMYR